jgi:MFS transporter, DHA3 family, macrolide efflux protein
MYILFHPYWVLKGFCMAKILLIIIGQFISLIGSSIQTTAIPLYILQTTHSGLMVSISQIISITAPVLISPLAGVMGDRYNRKTILIASDFVSASIVFVLFILFTLNVNGLAALFVSQALCTASECLLMTSLFAIIPDIVTDSYVTKANALKSISSGLALFAGPMLGGVVFGFLGIKAVFLINAMSFVVSALLAIPIKYRRTTAPSTVRLTIGTISADIKEVLAYIWHTETLRRLTRFAIVINMACAPILYVIIPFLTMNVIKMQSQQYGVIQSFYMGGFIVGGFILSAIKLRSTRWMVRPSLLLLGGSTLALSLVSVHPLAGVFGNVIAISVLILLMGLSDSICSTVVQTEIQVTARPDIMSRLGGVLNMAFQVSMPLGLLLVGLLIDKLAHVYLVFVPIALFLVVFIAVSSKNLFPPKKLGSGEQQDDAQNPSFE